MFYSYLDLTHRMQNIPPAPFQIIVDSFIPGIVMLVVLAFIVLMVDFWRFMTQAPNLRKFLSKDGG
jgi:hypothetical protein